MLVNLIEKNELFLLFSSLHIDSIPSGPDYLFRSDPS